MSNLQRQIIHTTARVGAPKVESAATAIRALNPDVTVDTYYELVDASNIAGLIEPYDLVIDATHPYAASITESICTACRETETEYLRLLRQSCDPKEALVCVENAAEAAVAELKALDKVEAVRVADFS